MRELTGGRHTFWSPGQETVAALKKQVDKALFAKTRLLHQVCLKQLRVGPPS